MVKLVMNAAAPGVHANVPLLVAEPETLQRRPSVLTVPLVIVTGLSRVKVLSEGDVPDGLTTDEPVLSGVAPSKI
jgi:cytochrome c-type biogenesis protein CcmE